jgi:hypothetical protein
LISRALGFAATNGSVPSISILISSQLVVVADVFQHCIVVPRPGGTLVSTNQPTAPLSKNTGSLQPQYDDPLNPSHSGTSPPSRQRLSIPM